MNKSKLLFSTALACMCFSIQAKASDISTNLARLQAMDKITGKVSQIDVPVNGLANFGTFSILVRKCVTRSPEETPENTAFVDIVDNYKTDNPVNIFKGWMFSSTPALHAVEHPIYDVWLLKCHNGDISKYTILSEEQLALRDTIPLSHPQKIEVSTSIVDAEAEVPEETTTEKLSVEPKTDENTEIVNLNIEQISNTDDTAASSDDDFVSEDENIITEDTTQEEIVETDSDNNENSENITDSSNNE